MTFLIGLLGALIGALAAIVGQILNHRYAKRREGDQLVRESAAELLGRGREVIQFVRRARATGTPDNGGLSRAMTPYFAAMYRLRWAAPTEIESATTRFTDEMGILVADWNVSRDVEFIDQDVADAANDLDEVVHRYLSRSGRVANTWRRVVGRRAGEP